MKPSVNLAFYRKKDWSRFLESIDDRESMHETWEEWHDAYYKAKKSLISQGFIVHDCNVNIDDLVDYCRKRGIKNDGKARSQFVAKR
jgi:hypothetical protein